MFRYNLLIACFFYGFVYSPLFPHPTIYKVISTLLFFSISVFVSHKILMIYLLTPSFAWSTSDDELGLSKSILHLTEKPGGFASVSATCEKQGCQNPIREGTLARTRINHSKLQTSCYNRIRGWNWCQQFLAYDSSLKIQEGIVQKL